MKAKAPFTPEATVASVEQFLSQQYDERHIQNLPVVRRDGWLDVADKLVRGWLMDFIVSVGRK